MTVSNPDILYHGDQNPESLDAAELTCASFHAKPEIDGKSKFERRKPSTRPPERSQLEIRPHQNPHRFERFNQERHPLQSKDGCARGRTELICSASGDRTFQGLQCQF